MLHIPILRSGQPYKSVQTLPLKDCRTGEQLAEISVANPGLITKDILNIDKNKSRLEELRVSQLIDLCRQAGEIYATGTLSIDGEAQSPLDYLRNLSATTGMPESLCLWNMSKIRFVLENMEEVITGLTRGLDLSILDQGWGMEDRRAISYQCTTNSLGVILPNNSPGVHSLWLPAVPLKVPLVLKPGRQEPWTPYRIIQSFLAAGGPPEAFSFYPTDYAGSNEILLRCGRSMLFGDESTLQKWKQDSRVQLHGPGWSKIIIGEDQIASWEQHLDLMITSILENSGRSCINASSIWVPSHGREIAEALARWLARVNARPLQHPAAKLAVFTDPTIAERISGMIDHQLKIPGALDITAKYREGKRVVSTDGCTFLLPTIVWTKDPEHPLAQAEFLFPFCTVVEVPQNRMLDSIGPSLVVTAITNDQNFLRQLVACRKIDRLNLGAMPTTKVYWDQPHEGNLFQHLYQQRALQKV